MLSDFLSFELQSMDSSDGRIFDDSRKNAVEPNRVTYTSLVGAALFPTDSGLLVSGSAADGWHFCSPVES